MKVEDIKADSQMLLHDIRLALEKLNIDEKQKKRDELAKQMESPDFWSDTVLAQKISKRHAKLNQHIEPWLELHENAKEITEMASLGDESMSSELAKSLKVLKARHESRMNDLKFNGAYDDYDAIIAFQAGAGGTDAQDWAQMLQRMYVRWAEQNDMKVELIDEAPGDEAGIKSATLAISGVHAFGKLKGEHGVHRLVRISPFNSGGTRETSFAMVEVLPQIEEPDEVKIQDSDLRVDVYRASGHGGQSVNTTDSAVRITHIPTGIVVAIQNEKSQIQNKETAMKVLRSKLAQLQIEQHKEKIEDLKGPSKEVAWGSQIRSYVLNPYTMVKDTRTKHETTDVKAVLDGQINDFIDAYLTL